MRIKQEFYIAELFHLMRGINLQMEENSKNIKAAARKYAVMRMLMPWRAAELGERLIAASVESIELTRTLQEISGKIMDSEGIDENGERIGLKEMMDLADES